MTIAAAAIVLALLLAYAAYNLPDVAPTPEPEASTAERRRGGTFLRAGHLTRALEARAAVRGDDGVVTVRAGSRA
ncbi:hypothetical protein K7W42_18110 [Deinococcus sp. HMF7604]|uniref:hypothetical protein n=1 Tax=Deinococcus betulae TaxID=2873312 RepID=UPI001CCD1ED7|nr:hypothetical protein [Deinococcus betulae]MBZ9752759.1 hypothetical protein [Deinococcus betulae]